MAKTFEELLVAAQRWADNAQGAGWLAASDIRTLSEIENRSPAELFEAGTHRPLVAAFFGGTGVGKSTLLNRLAGQDIARTGVERPTSREVSIFLHESVQLRHLPRNFPLTSVRSAVHRDDSRRQVLWIDMPDIDSVEQLNRELVLDWLPHIDVLIYVVSPERYRDDKGWRMLRAHGGDHAWVFIMNQWDRGHPAQLDDFRNLLETADFHDPIVLRTDCRRERPSDSEDDFEQLQQLLTAMAEQHMVRQLELRAEAQRREHLGAALAHCLSRLSPTAGYRDMLPVWRRIWDDTETDLVKGLEWPIQVVAQAFVGREANPLRRRLDLAKAPPADADPAAASSLLWDSWADSRLRDTLDRLVVETGDKGLPALPLKSRLQQTAESAGRDVLNECQRSLRQSLARPGSIWRRGALRIAGAFAVLLPLGALGWASYRVVKGYYDSELHQVEYLGTDFAIHSLLLIGLAWALPYFLYRSLKPSAERAAIKGLRTGLTAALTATSEGVESAIDELENQRRKVSEAGKEIWSEARAAVAPAKPDDVESDLLRRVLPRRNAESAANHSMRSK